MKQKYRISETLFPKNNDLFHIIIESLISVTYVLCVTIVRVCNEMK